MVDSCEGERGSLFEFGVCAGSNLKPAELLVGDTQACGEDGDGDADALAFGSQLSARGVLGGGVEQRGVNLVGDVTFEAVHDVPVGESFGPAAGEVGNRSRFLVSSAQQQDSAQGRIGLPISAAREPMPCALPR